MTYYVSLEGNRAKLCSTLVGKLIGFGAEVTLVDKNYHYINRNADIFIATCDDNVWNLCTLKRLEKNKSYSLSAGAKAFLEDRSKQW